MASYTEACEIADRMESREVGAQRRRGEHSSMDIVSVVDLHCEACGDAARGNCADTIRTFAGMHIGCQIDIIKVA